MSDTAAACLDRRRAGVLCHPTSFPGPGARGVLGIEAYRFIDFLAEAGFSVWQTLPLNPPDATGSPYLSSSVHAMDTALIDAGYLQARDWLDAGKDVVHEQDLAGIWRRFEARADADAKQALAGFEKQHAHWLEDYALYNVIKTHCDGLPWFDWLPPLRDREAGALAAFRAEHTLETRAAVLGQFLAFAQWHGIRAHAARRGVRLFGDMPIFVAHDSAEVWAHRELFQLDAQGHALEVAGVPPDYFSEQGQRWGNPLYDWRAMRAQGFAWWKARLATQLDLFDLVRVDHFRGFQAYWAIPADEPTAINGVWREAAGQALFESLHEAFKPLPIVAEDLGVITPDVEALRERFGLPGMKILQFAFDGDANNAYLPHRHVANCVVYTGTHDNNTALGWYHELDEAGRARVDDYLGYPAEAMPWPLLRCALRSPARLAMLPMQDVLSLDQAHRMNVPGSDSGNWRWRFDWHQIDAGLGARLRHLNTIYGRLAT